MKENAREFFFFDCFSCYNNLFLNLLLSRFLCSFFFCFSLFSYSTTLFFFFMKCTIILCRR